MFYGAAIKPGASVKLEPEGGEILHISGACLANPTSDERAYLVLNYENKSHVLCALKKDVAENVTLDLFIPTATGASFSVKGKAEVHVIGYYEPMDDESDISSDDDDDEGISIHEDEEESTQVSSDEERGKTHKQIEELKDDDENDDDEDDDEDEEKNQLEDDDNEDDDESEDDDDDDEEELKKALEQQLAQKKNEKAMKKPDIKQKKQIPEKKQINEKKQTNDKKRKATELNTKGEKQQKTGNAGTSAVIQQFEKSVADYLRKHGRSMIAQVASSCPKPSSITVKYREFLTSRPSLFVVDGQHAALKA